jgi:hypothetical protein
MFSFPHCLHSVRFCDANDLLLDHHHHNVSRPKNRQGCIEAVCLVACPPVIDCQCVSPNNCARNGRAFARPQAAIDDTAVLGGHVQMTFENITILLPLIQEHQVRALAVTSLNRSPMAPELPTMMESGVSEYVVTTFLGLVAPAGTPSGIISQLNLTINNGLNSSGMQASFGKLGATPKISTPQEFGAFFAAEIQKWSVVARSAGIEVD